jgi:MFS superfamily sulfate permease-like transporter
VLVGGREALGRLSTARFPILVAIGTAFGSLAHVWWLFGEFRRLEGRATGSRVAGRLDTTHQRRGVTDTGSAVAHEKPAGGIRNGVVSGFATGLFSIPEGMAYAQLAGVDPVYGLYSGIVATVVASLTTGTVLMISTLTSAIALTVGSVIEEAGLP